MNNTSIVNVMRIGLLGLAAFFLVSAAAPTVVMAQGCGSDDAFGSYFLGATTGNVVAQPAEEYGILGPLLRDFEGPGAYSHTVEISSGDGRKITQSIADSFTVDGNNCSNPASPQDLEGMEPGYMYRVEKYESNYSGDGGYLGWRDGHLLDTSASNCPAPPAGWDVDDVRYPLAALVSTHPTSGYHNTCTGMQTHSCGVTDATHGSELPGSLAKIYYQQLADVVKDQCVTQGLGINIFTKVLAELFSLGTCPGQTTLCERIGHQVANRIFWNVATADDLTDAEWDNYPGATKAHVSPTNMVDSLSVVGASRVMPGTFVWDCYGVPGVSWDPASEENVYHHPEDGLNLQKTGPNGWNAGAISKHKFTGEGHMTFTAPAPDQSQSQFLMAGLSTGFNGTWVESPVNPPGYFSNTAGFGDIDYAIHLKASTSEFKVWEAGVWKKNAGTFAAGDVFAVEIANSGTQVLYKRNGTTFYSHAISVDPKPYYIDMSLWLSGMTVSGWSIGPGPAPGPPSPPSGPITWDPATKVGVSTTSTSVTKTAANGWTNGGVASLDEISGDGWVEFTANASNTHRMIGLSNGNTNSSYTDIDFAAYLLSNGAVRVYEKGSYKGQFGTYDVGDQFRVESSGGVIDYKKNGVTFYTSGAAPTYPLIVDTSIYSSGGGVTGMGVVGSVVGSGSPPEPVSLSIDNYSFEMGSFYSCGQFGYLPTYWDQYSCSSSDYQYTYSVSYAAQGSDAFFQYNGSGTNTSTDSGPIAATGGKTVTVTAAVGKYYYTSANMRLLYYSDYSPTGCTGYLGNGSVGMYGWGSGCNASGCWSLTDKSFSVALPSNAECVMLRLENYSPSFVAWDNIRMTEL